MLYDLSFLFDHGEDWCGTLKGHDVFLWYGGKYTFGETLATYMKCMY